MRKKNGDGIFAAARSVVAGLAVIAGTIVFASQAAAALVTVNFSWAGQGGYTAEGSMTYDDSLAQVTSPVGGGGAGGGLGNTVGIESLEVNFYDPANVLIASYTNVSGGVSSYQYLQITFDTASQQFTGSFDIGEDVGINGDTYLCCAIGGGLSLEEIGTGTLDNDPAGTITVTAAPVAPPAPAQPPKPVPLMSVYSLLATILGLLALGAVQSSRRERV